MSTLAASNRNFSLDGKDIINQQMRPRQFENKMPFVSAHIVTSDTITIMSENKY